MFADMEACCESPEAVGRPPSRPPKSVWALLLLIRSGALDHWLSGGRTPRFSAFDHFSGVGTVDGFKPLTSAGWRVSWTVREPCRHASCPPASPSGFRRLHPSSRCSISQQVKSGPGALLQGRQASSRRLRSAVLGLPARTPGRERALPWPQSPAVEGRLPGRTQGP